MRKILTVLMCAAMLALPTSALTGVVATQSTSLNVRSSPTTSSQIVGSLARGSTVELTEKVNDGWWKVPGGYVSAAYISTSASSGDITLDVPSYKQYDSRWSSVRLGSYGATIRTIGCTVTCVAMLESYYSNSTITPASVAASNSFTSGGALYWPSSYTRSTPSNLSAFLLENLAAGSPVILHGRSPSGSSHWVVVHSFSNSSFLINDPGSSSTTLTSFLSKYPEIVKVVVR